MCVSLTGAHLILRVSMEEYGPVDEKFEFWRENKCDECVPGGPESLPTKFHLLMFSIYRGIDVKTAELSFGTPCIYETGLLTNRN